jgi:hypothetical protein
MSYEMTSIHPTLPYAHPITAQASTLCRDKNQYPASSPRPYLAILAFVSQHSAVLSRRVELGSTTLLSDSIEALPSMPVR